MRIPPLVAALLAATTAACWSPDVTGLSTHDSNPIDVSRTGNLNALPLDGAVIPQNDSTIGCDFHQFRGFGFAIDFQWDAVVLPAGGSYEITVQHTGSPYPALTRRTTENRLLWKSCHSFVIDSNMSDWTWKVSIVVPPTAPVSPPLVSRKFSFAPCRVAGKPCTAPAP